MFFSLKCDKNSTFKLPNLRRFLSTQAKLEQFIATIAQQFTEFRILSYQYIVSSYLKTASVRETTSQLLKSQIKMIL